MSSGGSLGGIVRLVHHAKLERRGLAEDLLHFGGILQAGQLDRDSVHAFARHLRLGDGEFRAVQAVAQDHDVLLDGVILALLDLRIGELQFESR